MRRSRSFVFEMTGSTEKLNAFISLMQPLGLSDVSRTGIVAMKRGSERNESHARLERGAWSRLVLLKGKDHACLLRS